MPRFSFYSGPIDHAKGCGGQGGPVVQRGCEVGLPGILNAIKAMRLKAGKITCRKVIFVSGSIVVFDYEGLENGTLLIRLMLLDSPGRDAVNVMLPGTRVERIAMRLMPSSVFR